MSPQEQHEIARTVTMILGHILILLLFIWRGRARGWSWLKAGSIGAGSLVSWGLALLIYWLLVLRQKRAARVIAAAAGR